MKLPLPERLSLRFIILSFSVGIKTSIKHKERFGKLRKHLPEKLCKIGKFRADFNAEFIIGRGCGATAVYIGLSDDGTEVAVKRMLTYTLKDKAKIKKRMSNLMNIEESPHIVKYYHFQLGEPFSYSVFQLCEQTLEEYVDLVRKTRPTDLQKKLNKQAPTMIREILAGLLAIHGTGREKRILHMNLKPSNIFVDVDGHVRLANFGISMRLCKDSSIHNNEEECTLHWRAVESQTTEDKPNRKVKYTKKSDIQVAGMLSYYILREGDHPFGEKSVRVRNLIDGNPVDLDKLSNPAAKDLISWMLQKKSKNRPLAEEALKHPYIQDRDQQFLMLIYFSCEQEIDRNDLKCDVVKELNDDSMLNNLRWKSEIDSEVHNQMKTSRYDDSASALVRFIRTASEHSWTQNVPDDPARYFLDKFPVLPLVVHRIIRKRQDWRERPQLKIFFTSEK